MKLYIVISKVKSRPKYMVIIFNEEEEKKKTIFRR